MVYNGNGNFTEGKRRNKNDEGKSKMIYCLAYLNT